MIRQLMIGVLAVAGLAAGGWTWLQRRDRRQRGAHDPVQWPFDIDELRALMTRVVSEQQDRVSAIEDQAGRDRAQAFLEYYERRRQAIAS